MDCSDPMGASGFFGGLAAQIGGGDLNMRIGWVVARFGSDRPGLRRNDGSCVARSFAYVSLAHAPITFACRSSPTSSPTRAAPCLLMCHGRVSTPSSAPRMIVRRAGLADVVAPIGRRLGSKCLLAHVPIRAAGRPSRGAALQSMAYGQTLKLEDTHLVDRTLDIRPTPPRRKDLRLVGGRSS